MAETFTPIELEALPQTLFSGTVLDYTRESLENSNSYRSRTTGEMVWLTPRLRIAYIAACVRAEQYKQKPIVLVVDSRQLNQAYTEEIDYIITTEVPREAILGAYELTRGTENPIYWTDDPTKILEEHFNKVQLDIDEQT